MSTTALVRVAGTTAPAPQGSNVRVFKRQDLSKLPPRTQAAAIQNRSYEFEDEYSGLYDTAAFRGGQVIAPPFLPRLLESLCQTNNTLSVCIDAVVTNVHRSGYDIVAESEADKGGKQHKAIEGFFKTIYPQESFTSLRKELGYDVEKTGNGYLEVLRNVLGKIMMVRRLDPKLMRLVRQDEAVVYDVDLVRDGDKVTVPALMRHRRFTQSLGGQNLRWYKEYGCKRRLNAIDGLWVEPGQPLALADNASEIIHFKAMDDSLTPYGIPRWAPQTPSVLGSRKAEEMNLDFFEAGGVPPIMIFVHGGQLTETAAEALRNHVQGGKLNKHDIPVIEAMSTSGSLDGAGSVKVTVERFGSERQMDSMFENYDAQCEKRIRRAWRLPPLFVGAAEDLNFATAAASYMLAESQTFAPERGSFDEKITRTILAELDPEGKFSFRSRPISVRDIASQMKAIEMAVNNGTLSKEQLIELLNEVTNLKMRKDESDIAVPVQFVAQLNADGAGAPSDSGGGRPAGGKDVNKKPARVLGKPTAKAALDAISPESLAERALELFNDGASPSVMLKFIQQVGVLKGDDAWAFKDRLTELALGGYTAAGGVDLAEAVTNVVLSMIPDAEIAEPA